VGTFVGSDVAPLPADDLSALRPALQRWITRARAAGLDDDNIAALFADTLRPPAVSRVA
jgi:GntR family transcriptional regulator